MKGYGKAPDNHNLGLDDGVVSVREELLPRGIRLGACAERTYLNVQELILWFGAHDRAETPAAQG